MKLMRNNRNRWSMTFTLVFAVQLLVSALCIIPSAQAAVAIEANHCHEAMQHNSGQQPNMQHEMGAKQMQAQPEQLPTSACSHCASPASFAVFINDLNISPTDLLFAFVVLETYSTTATTASLNFMERAQAPPRSSSTLYNTTQRIRI
jgi:hypothetical protein